MQEVAMLMCLDARPMGLKIKFDGLDLENRQHKESYESLYTKTLMFREDRG